MEKKLYELRVDEELKRVAPPLADNELEILKEDILEHGCKFPLIVWGDTIVDGHNRYRICRENDIPFGIESMEFSDKTEAKLWIIKNQLGRRNLKPFQRCEMVLPMEDELKTDAKKRMSPIERGMQKFAGPTRNILADMAGVSYATLDKVKVILVEADEDMLSKLRSGDMKIHTAYKAIGKKEKTKAEPEDEPVVAAHLEGSIPFEPIQRDAEPEEIMDALDDVGADISRILDKLTPGNVTDDLIQRIREWIEQLNRAVDSRLNEMEES